MPSRLTLAQELALCTIAYAAPLSARLAGELGAIVPSLVSLVFDPRGHVSPRHSASAYR